MEKCALRKSLVFSISHFAMDNLPKPTCSVLETEVNNDLSRKFEFISDRYVLRNEENSEELDYMPLEYDFSVLDLYNNKLV